MDFFFYILFGSSVRCEACDPRIIFTLCCLVHGILSHFFVRCVRISPAAVKLMGKVQMFFVVEGL